MTAYYSRTSIECVGTTQEFECSTTKMRNELLALAERGIPVKGLGLPPLTCSGEVVWVWLHSGQGGSESLLCESCREQKDAEGVRAAWRFGYEHAIFRDAEGVWRVKDHASQLD